jgi:hypothetical protein
VPRSRRAGALALLCALATSCQHLGGARGACAGSVAVAGAPRTLHLRVLLEHDGVRQRHEAVVQVEAERIRVFGLTPMGTRAFTLTDQAERLELDDRVGRRMGLNPRLVYDAIAHAFLAPPSGGDDLVVLREPGPLPAARVRNPGCGYEAWLVVLSDDAGPGPP